MIKNNNYYSDIANNLKKDNDNNKYKEILYNKYYNKLLIFISSKFINIPKDRYHDITTDSILRSFDKIYQYDSDKSSYTTWLHAITYKKCLFYLLNNSEKNTEYLIDPLNFDEIGANKSITGNKLKIILKDLNVYSNKHPLDKSEKMFDNFNDSDINDRYKVISELILNNTKKSDTNLIEDYFLNNYTLEELTKKYKINLNTIKSKLRLNKNKIVEKYRHKYPNDINLEKKKRRNLESYLKGKERIKEINKILLKKDIITIITNLNCNNVKRMIYIDYIFNKIRPVDLVNKYKLKNKEYVYANKCEIEKKLYELYKE